MSEKYKVGEIYHFMDQGSRDSDFIAIMLTTTSERSLIKLTSLWEQYEGHRDHVGRTWRGSQVSAVSYNAEVDNRVFE